MASAALLQLYARCHYEVRLPGGGSRAVLRIGQPLLPVLQRWRGDAPLCAFVTAYNPLARRQPAAANRAAQHALLQTLRGQGARWLAGVGREPGQPWREPSLLVAGLDFDAIDALARHHSQIAVVVAHGNAPVQLRTYACAAQAGAHSPP